MEASQESASDPVGLVLGGLGFGITLGIAVQALVTWTVRGLQHGQPAGPPSLTSAAALVLLIGTLAGIAAGGIATFMILGPIRNPWRQAMLAMIAGLGSFVMSLVTLPIDRRFGRPGLLALAVLAGGGCYWIGRRMVRRRETP